MRGARWLLHACPPSRPRDARHALDRPLGPTAQPPAHVSGPASALQPTSLRARFGSSKVKNAVHCTDLPEDGPLEVDYFFGILQQ